MRRIAVGPADRSRVLVVARDVSPNLARQVGKRREDATSEEVRFDLGKPEFHLVEPRRIRRREVKMHARMPVEERGDVTNFRQPFDLLADTATAATQALAADGWDRAKREIWLGGRDSNPDSTVQSRVSYH